ncbi:MAG: sensor of ECF-type sigma factor [Flavobacterium sp.]
MKNIQLFIPLVLMLSLTSMTAQDRPSKEQIKSMKVAFITTELNLSSDESVKFWPIYNAYDEKLYELRGTKMRQYINRMDQNIEQLSDKEAESLLSDIQKAEEELHQLRKKLISDLKGVISPVKILKLKKAEEDFNRNLLRQYRGKGRNNNN